RLHLLKHGTRTIPAEIRPGIVLNQIAPVHVSASRALVFDRYTDIRAMGSLIVIDPATNFTAGAGMILEPQYGQSAAARMTSAPERLAHMARTAASQTDAVEAVRRALEEMLT